MSARVLQFLFAARQLTPGAAASRADPWQGLSHAVAALYASDGGGINRPCVDAERGLIVSGAALAPASGGVSTQGGGKRQREGA